MKVPYTPSSVQLSVLLRYGVAVGATVLALVLTLLIRPSLHDPVFALFFVAVLVSSWYGGLGPGLFATALSVILADYYTFPPPGQFPLDADIALRLGVEVVAALIISSLTAARRRIAATLREQREQLQAARDQFEVILGSVADGIVAEAPDGRLLYANAAAAQVVGYPSVQAMLDSVPGERLQRFVIMDEAGQPLPPYQLPGRLVLRGAEQAARVVRYRALATGQEHWTMVQARPVRDPHGQIVMSIAIMHDITAQKQAEEERAQLLDRERTARTMAEVARRQASFLAEASRILASSLDYSTTLTHVAQLAVPMLADWCGVYILDEQHEIQLLAVAHVDATKVPLAYALHHQYPPTLTASGGVGATLRTGQAELVTHVSDEMLVATARDAQHLALLRTIGFISLMIVPLTARGHTLAALAFVSSQPRRTYEPEDVAFAEELARRAAQAIDNAQLYQNAQNAIRLRDQFLSIAAHELKTPLTSLMGQAQLFQRRAEREGHLTERDQRTLRVINDQAARLNKMVTALLDVSRLEMGQLRIERAPMDICALVRRVVGEAQPTVEDRIIQLRCPDGPIIIDGDELRLEQVIQNLIQNALKYSQPPEPVTVTVTQQGDQVCVAVQDYGMGIPSAALPNLFQRFYRADNAEERHISGMGIGLYVVREIVGLHHGAVTVDSTEGAGSTFTVCLPQKGV